MNSNLSRYLAPGIAVGLGIIYLTGVMIQFEDPPNKMQIQRFAALTVVHHGRLQPIDTVARNSLMIISGKQTFYDERDSRQSAVKWLLDVMTTPAPASGKDGPANHYKVFRIENEEVLSLLGLEARKGFRYSIVEILPRLNDFETQANRARKVHPKSRDLYDVKLVELADHFSLYAKLCVGELPLMVPPAGGTSDEWQSRIDAFQNYRHAERNNPAVVALAEMLMAHKTDNAREFNRALADYEKLLAQQRPEDIEKTGFETFINHFAPFYHCSVLYVIVFILACASFIAFPRPLNRAAMGLALVTLVVHTFALLSRMYLMDRPLVFVTNLYSSAVFIGWMCVILGLILEWIYKNGIGNVVAAVTGSLTLLIGHYLATSGDTLEMMQAVLDTNFWLATHVTIITIGYSATFVAGFLGILLIGLGVFTTALTKEQYREFGRMIYGVICFAMLFSFTGTVLGGIWADQSWGRFWGWDPKENGALLIVLMNALILHARWGGLIQQRGMAVLAVVGNIVTAWSWFGVNMLGVGLHSYGFMSGAVWWLLIFVFSQLLIVSLGLIPMHMWRSFAPPKPLAPPAPDLHSPRREEALSVPRIKAGPSKSKFIKAKR
jgi:ABC-type transport system involved in cytochrome c biogenesis permease subunit